ncbi:GNAT family protein [Pseudomonas sp. MAG002Y]|uniref:GNAT family N-acetyltransferase n=1 Tax=Pseudomonas sp. MAG002Y TaxID=2678690 RepID=UPI0027E4C939|nr:GNAT family protein [Pseudomonas sp. MAG002Y]
MMNREKIRNAYQQPIGQPLAEWTERSRPSRTVKEGRYCRLEPLNAEIHASDLYEAYGHAEDGRDWTYMLSGPFTHEADYHRFAEQAAASEDPMHFAVVDLRSGRAVGTLSLMRIDPANGVMEVGHVAFSSLMKRSILSTEAHYLLMYHAFEDLGYRRYEWKCDSLNEPSRQAALRLGFQFEGVFRQALVYKGRSRDTAWFSIIDTEWPVLRNAFTGWLDPANFNEDGQQLRSLQAFQRSARVNDPLG